MRVSKAEGGAKDLILDNEVTPVAEDPWMAKTERADSGDVPMELNVTAVDLSADPLSENELVGRVVLHRFQVEHLMSKGATSRVFRGTCLDDGHPVAIKIPDRVDDPNLQDNARIRFDREVAFLRKMNHPSVVELIDHGTTPTGDDVIVMELLNGQTLEDRLKNTGTLSARNTMNIGRQIAESALRVHTLGAVHRDLKPANVFLCKIPGNKDQVKLLDFGLVKPIGHEGPDDGNITRSGTIIGTPTYMSPEQAMGGVLDPRSDIYTLGILMFEMMAGRPPFVGDSLHAVLDQQIKLQVPPLASINRQISCPSALEQLIRICTRKDRGTRPDSMQEVLGLIDNIERGLEEAYQATSNLDPIEPMPAFEESEAPTDDLDFHEDEPTPFFDAFDMTS